MVKKVFISHTQADTEIAESFAKEIGSRGMSVISDKNILALNDWEAILRKQTLNASSFVAIISPLYIKSSWNMQELGAALASGKKIVPVLIDEAKMPFDISKYKFVDGSKMQDAEVKKRLLEAVAA